MSEIPAGAITAAAKAIEEAIEYWDGWIDPEGLAKEALEAAAAYEAGPHEHCHCQGPLDTCCSPVHDRGGAT